MGLKKYEIITVGSDKRVRALRSWKVGDRYVNIGDVGGIVYDEKTLSQDGACWLFRGNFSFPGARIGGDSIVDVGEAALSATGSPAVDILGSSVVVGSKLLFESERTAADAVTLTAADFEQGTFNYTAGTNWETWKAGSANQLRTKAPIFMGGKATTLKLDVPGYAVQAYVLDRDGIGLTATASTNTGEGVTLAVPAGQYMVIRLAKNPAAPIVPDDATAARITFTGTYETKLVMVDSRLEVNPPTSTGTAGIRPGGSHGVIPGVKYPDTVIRDSKVNIMIAAGASRNVRLMADFSNVNATIDATTSNAQGLGTYRNVNNLVFSGNLTGTINVLIPGMIRAYDCDNMVVTAANFPNFAGIISANAPIKFYGCNLNTARIYHHAQIANTYRDINFDLATADLGKTFGTDRVLVSSEVNGMYRAWFATDFGALIESHESVKSLTGVHVGNSYNTTIYADAYINGALTFAGTNVFGNKVRSHPLAQVLNVQPRAVRGNFDSTTIGGTITGVITDNRFCVIPVPFRVNGTNGIIVQGLPENISALGFFTTLTGLITTTSSLTGSPISTSRLPEILVYVRFSKAGGAEITPEDLAGVTVTTYNGCKIVNTKKTAATIAGNVRVEDNATLIDTSVTGTGYFGGNSIAQGLTAEGAAYMKDNAVIVLPDGSASIRSLKMTENAYAAPGALTLNGHLWLSGNSRFTPAAAASGNGDLFMEDNAVISGSVSVSGSLTMKDNAKVSGGTLTAYGDVIVCGSYNQTVSKTWTGKRTITDVNAPEYDNNVKTQYDF